MARGPHAAWGWGRLDQLQERRRRRRGEAEPGQLEIPQQRQEKDPMVPFGLAGHRLAPGAGAAAGAQAVRSPSTSCPSSRRCLRGQCQASPTQQPWAASAPPPLHLQPGFPHSVAHTAHPIPCSLASRAASSVACPTPCSMSCVSCPIPLQPGVPHRACQTVHPTLCTPHHAPHAVHPMRRVASCHRLPWH